jgi:hypothetical protein
VNSPQAGAQHGGTNKTLAAPSVIDYGGIAL